MNLWQKPLVSTSANPSGAAPAESHEEVIAYFQNNVDYVLDGGKRNLLKPSTVLDCSIAIPKLIREGAISKEELAQFTGNINE